MRKIPDRLKRTLSPITQTVPDCSSLAREVRDLLAKLGERHSAGHCTLRNQTELGHPRQRVRFETVKIAASPHTSIIGRRQPKINPCTPSQLESPKCGKPLPLDFGGLFRGQICRKLLFRHARSVLALVIVNLVLRLDLPNGKNTVSKDSDSQLSAGNELLDHHFIVEPPCFRHCRLKLVSLLYDSQSDGRPLFRWFDNDRQPESALDLSDRRGRHEPVGG